jgi:hypothetical protein
MAKETKRERAEHRAKQRRMTDETGESKRRGKKKTERKMHENRKGGAEEDGSKRSALWSEEENGEENAGRCLLPVQTICPPQPLPRACSP